MDKKLGNILKFILSAALAAVLVYLACRGIDWGAFVDGLKTTRWGWIVMFLLAAAGALTSRSLRWRQVLLVHDPDIRFGRIFDATCIGALSNFVLPGSGEFVRCGLVTSDKVRYDTSLGVIAIERVCDIFAVLLLFLLALFTGWERFGDFFVNKLWASLSSSSVWLWIIVGLLLLLVVFLVLVGVLKDRSPLTAKVYGMLKGFFSGFASLARMPRKLPFIIFTFCIWICYMLMSYFIMRALPAFDGLGVGDAMFISALGNAASLVPVPGGIGAYHFFIRQVLASVYGIATEMGLLFATLNHELYTCFAITMGTIAYFKRIVLPKKRNAEQK